MAHEIRVGDWSLSHIVRERLWKSESLSRIANVCFPPTALDDLPPFHRPALSVIVVDSDPAAREVYEVGDGLFMLAKPVVLRMLSAAGASWRTQKLTPESDLDNIRWTAVVWGRLPDGTYHQGQASRAWSWEKCQESMKPRQALQYRMYADEQTETKALLRAARGFLCLKTTYTAAELSRPFLFARARLDPDTRDPEIRRLVVERALEARLALYAPPEAPPATPVASHYRHQGKDEEDDAELEAQPEPLAQGGASEITGPAARTQSQVAPPQDAARPPQAPGLGGDDAETETPRQALIKRIKERGQRLGLQPQFLSALARSVARRQGVELDDLSEQELGQVLRDLEARASRAGGGLC